MQVIFVLCLLMLFAGIVYFSGGIILFISQRKKKNKMMEKLKINKIKDIYKEKNIKNVINDKNLSLINSINDTKNENMNLDKQNEHGTSRNISKVDENFSENPIENEKYKKGLQRLKSVRNNLSSTHIDPLQQSHSFNIYNTQNQPLLSSNLPQDVNNLPSDTIYPVYDSKNNQKNKNNPYGSSKNYRLNHNRRKQRRLKRCK